jgi:hydroxylamine reductase
MSDNKITKDMILGDIVLRYPKTAKIMLEYGLHCVGCGASDMDTVEAGCKVHGMTDAEIDELVESMNQTIL